MVEAATSFRKNSFNDNDSATLAKVATTFQNVSDEAISASESADFIIAQMKAFNIEAGDAEHIIDAVNAVSNSYAVSSGKNSLSFGLVQAIVSEKNNILYCFSDSFEEKKAVAILISKTPVANSIECKFEKEINLIQSDEYFSFIDFLEKRTNKIITPVGILSRIDV